MPFGSIINVVCVICGGILGPVLGKRMSQKLKDDMTVMFGFIACMLAVISLVRVKNTGAVALTTIISFLIGTILDFDKSLKKGIGGICRKMFPSSSPEKAGQLSIYIVLFAFSATGIMGVIQEANGDSQLILCKAILDFVTAMIVSCELGRVTCLSAIPQALVYLFCYISAGLLESVLVGETYGDFCAVGGIMLMMVSLNMMKAVKTYPINGLLGFFLIVPVSQLWQQIF